MTGRTTKFLSKILCLVLGLIIGVGSCIIAGAIMHGKVPAADITAVQKNGDNTILSAGEANGMKLTSTKLKLSEYEANDIMPMAETAYRITASVYPETAIVQVDWAVEFKNPNSSWAQNKNVEEYFSVTPTSDGALTANAACIKAFGEQIILKATSREDKAVYGTCTVDYARRYSNLGAQLTFASTQFTVCEDEMGPDKSVMIPLYTYTTTSPNWRDAESSVTVDVYCHGLGTVAPEIISTKIEVKASEAFLKVYNAAPYYNFNGKITECAYKEWRTVLPREIGFSALIDNLSRPFAQNDGFCNEEDYQGFLRALTTYDSADFYIRLTTTIKYGENSVDEVSEYPCIFYRKSAPFRATSISLDNSSLVY